MTAALTRPEPCRIIPKAVVDALIADADRQTSALERQAERALAAADEAEARLDELGIDERASAWATIQLERFVTSLRADVADESESILAEARVRAQSIVDEATDEVGDRSEARFMRVLVPVPEVVGPRVVAPAECTPMVEERVADHSVFAAIAPESLDASEASEASVDLAPAETSFWTDPPERKHRFRRPASRTVAIQCSALALLVAAVVVRFG
jgi:cell division septum initiation protein DivIVA